MGEIIGRWQINQVFDADLNDVFGIVGRILSTLLVVPKSGQLRQKSITVCRQVLDVFILFGRSELLYVYKREIFVAVVDVVKDLGCEAVAKDAAREMKRRLGEIEDPEDEKEDDIGTF